MGGSPKFSWEALKGDSLRVLEETRGKDELGIPLEGSCGSLLGQDSERIFDKIGEGFKEFLQKGGGLSQVLKELLEETPGGIFPRGCLMHFDWFNKGPFEDRFLGDGIDSWVRLLGPTLL